MNARVPRSMVTGTLGTAAVVCVVLVASWVVRGTPEAATAGLVPRGAPAPAGGQTVAYSLPEGRTAEEVGQDLAAAGIIRSARQFRMLVGLMGVQEKLQAGDYTLPIGGSAASIANLLTVQQSVPTIRVTFPEGIRVEEMAVLAAKAGFGTASDFLLAAATVPLPAEFARDFPAGARSLDSPPAGSVSLQGYLFPDTYIMPEGSTAAELVQLMFETLDERFTPALRSAVRARGLTLHGALTLASIVEREAVLEKERPLIAGVFFNRLRAGDLLGADPTVQFAVSLNAANVVAHGWWKKELTAADLAIDSPYNTRKVPGLPPGPITNPGLASIKAVAAPAETTMYYFVADAKAKDGSHVFAETLEEHLRNIEIYGQ